MFFNSGFLLLCREWVVEFIKLDFGSYQKKMPFVAVLVDSNLEMFRFQGNLSKANQLFQLFNKKLADKKQESPSYKVTPEMEELIQNLEPALQLGEAAVIRSKSKKSTQQTV